MPFIPTLENPQKNTPQSDMVDIYVLLSRDQTMENDFANKLENDVTRLSQASKGCVYGILVKVRSLVHNST